MGEPTPHGYKPKPESPPSLRPIAPSPLALNHVRIKVVGTFFHLRQFFSPAPIAGFFGRSTCITSSLCSRYHVIVSHMYILWHLGPTVSPRKT